MISYPTSTFHHDRALSVRLGKFGAMAQIGTAEEEEKLLFASLHPDQQLTKMGTKYRKILHWWKKNQ